MGRLLSQIKSWFTSPDGPPPPDSDTAPALSRTQRDAALVNLLDRHGELAEKLQSLADRLEQQDRRTNAIDESVGQLPATTGELMRNVRDQSDAVKEIRTAVDALREASDTLATAVVRMDSKLDQVLTSQERAAGVMYDASETVRRQGDEAKSAAGRARRIIIALCVVAVLLSIAAIGGIAYLIQHLPTR